ncbi:thioredoxin domain-containing protein [Cerasicoccus maritimus]|uniref:thioredoxin domain-containing protein n=1 Tax=Cerasicoccus maritimus TaxID=490089 RepID=UPI002852C458|nr:thioredoxin domain-containing protein [Cerasicoccus maritimus]
MESRGLQQRQPFVIAMVLAGIAVASLSALEAKIPAIAEFCGLLGDGCHNAHEYRLFGLSLAPWGMLFYGVMGMLCLHRRQWVFWGAIVGFGFELALVRIMIENDFVCVFCAANFLVMLIIWILEFDTKRLWEMAALGLLSFTLAGSLITDGQLVKPNNETQVLALVDGTPIWLDEIERPLSAPLHRHELKIYELKNALLQNRINDRLLEVDAENRGISVDELLREIRSKIPLPASHIVDHYYESGLYRSLGEWTGTEAEVKDHIRVALHERDSSPLVLNYFELLRQKYPVEIFLAPPTLPSTRVRIDGAPSIGPADALVTVVEFSDYLCPSCRKSHAVTQKVKDKYAGKIRWVFKDYPLKRHPGARELALAARYADTQGTFWRFQDELFAAEKPDMQQVGILAEELGLDVDLLQQFVNDPVQRSALEQDIVAAREAGVSATPTYIINGKMRSGAPSFEEFSELIDQALAEAQELPKMESADGQGR